MHAMGAIFGAHSLAKFIAGKLPSFLFQVLPVEAFVRIECLKPAGSGSGSVRHWLGQAFHLQQRGP